VKLDTLTRGQQELKQELYTLSNNWLNSLQENVDEIKHEMEGFSLCPEARHNGQETAYVRSNVLL